MRIAILPALLVALSLATPAMAHHPGENLDEVMGDKEQFFQKIDEPAPPFDLADADGSPVRLSDFADKIVVLNFIFARCTDVCPLHSELVADVQSKINVTPMKDMVQFITVTTDPDVDTPDVLRGYGKAHGLDLDNWTVLTAQPGADIGRSGHAAQGRCQCFKHSVSGGVPVLIIDPFEVISVKTDQRNRMPQTTRLLNGALTKRKERPAIGQAGQRILMG